MVFRFWTVSLFNTPFQSRYIARHLFTAAICTVIPEGIFNKCLLKPFLFDGDNHGSNAAPYSTSLSLMETGEWQQGQRPWDGMSHSSSSSSPALTSRPSGSRLRKTAQCNPAGPARLLPGVCWKRSFSVSMETWSTVTSVRWPSVHVRVCVYVCVSLWKQM